MIMFIYYMLMQYALMLYSNNFYNIAYIIRNTLFSNEVVNMLI